MQMEDQQIIELYWGRSERAIEETAAKYGRYCHAIALGILHDDMEAEESVNDTWLDAWNSMPPHRPSVLAAFLGQITRRISIDRWRRRSAEKRGGGEIAVALEELSECATGGGDVEQEAELRALGEALNDFLHSLPRTEQQVFLCRYWYMDSIEDISKRFGFSQSKVKSMLHRTRGKLRGYLTEKGWGV